MTNLTLKQKIIITVTILGTALILIFQRGFYSKPAAVDTPVKQEAPLAEENARIISTTPSALDNAIVLPTQIIEITFNLPLQNPDELKHKLEPKVGYKIKLSDDRKTAKIIPQPTFNLGTEYTLNIQTNETKFDGGKKLERDYIYHFKTIEYKGV